MNNIGALITMLSLHSFDSVIAIEEVIITDSDVEIITDDDCQLITDLYTPI